MKSLVIVESGAKAKKIKGYLGVIGDDLFAGIITAIIILTLTYYGFI